MIVLHRVELYAGLPDVLLFSASGRHISINGTSCTPRLPCDTRNIPSKIVAAIVSSSDIRFSALIARMFTAAYDYQQNSKVSQEYRELENVCCTRATGLDGSTCRPVDASIRAELGENRPYESDS